MFFFAHHLRCAQFIIIAEGPQGKEKLSNEAGEQKIVGNEASYPFDFLSIHEFIYPSSNCD